MNYLILENINVQKSSRNAFCFVPAAFHFPSLVHCFPIRFLIHRFAPFRMGILSRNADCQVGEPAVCCCTVPVFDACRDVDDISCGHADGFFSFFLIKSSSCHAEFFSDDLNALTLPQFQHRIIEDSCNHIDILSQICQTVLLWLPILCNTGSRISHPYTSKLPPVSLAIPGGSGQTTVIPSCSPANDLLDHRRWRNI